MRQGRAPTHGATASDPARRQALGGAGAAKSLALSRAWPAIPGFAAVFVALGRPASLAPVGAGQQLLLTLPSWLLLAAAASLVAAFLAIVAALLPAPRPKDDELYVHEPPPLPRLSPLLIAALLLAAIAILAGGLFAPQAIHQGSSPAVLQGGLAPLPQAPRPVPASPPAPLHQSLADLGTAGVVALVVLLIFAFAAAVIVAARPWDTLAAWLRRRPRRAARPSGADLGAAVAAGIDALQATDDPRAAVIACYRRSEAELARRMRHRYAAETAREFMQDALARLSLPDAPPQALLSVFERARFGSAAIGEADRDTALEALQRLRVALEEQKRG